MECGPAVRPHGSAGRWPAAWPHGASDKAGQRPALPERCALRAPAHATRGPAVRTQSAPTVVPAAGRQLGRTSASARPASGRLYQSDVRCARLRTRRAGQRSAPTVVPAAGRQLGRTMHRQSRPAAGSTRAMRVARACARDVRANGPHPVRPHGSAGRWPAAWRHGASAKPASGRLYQSDARCARLRTRRARQRSALSPFPR